ncbi:MAG TPA: glycosyltransferase [Dinghuibacter sp.]|uniref:glycosyltransferase n=1 Tax=Dinghuibacter sp. TaxID=2024697 RepID=UPI002B815D6E|nr:glycosyltransferase [Dinghuibacter sp.]HTJ11879.1 glycosyltransferase [Dinghuibacter sp.]
MDRPLAFNLLIPCYNNREGLVRALRSVAYPADQFGILVIDDGSDEPIAQHWLQQEIDGPVSVLRLPRNLGITAALNAGLEWVERNRPARYTARLDCDDVCALRRFYEQVSFLDEHPEIDLVGSWCIFREPESGYEYLYKTPTAHDDIKKGMYFRNLFIHPTVMWRASKQKYPDDFPHAEDYGLFQEMLKEGKGEVIPQPLVTCALDPNGLSRKNRQEQLRSRIKVVRHFGENKWLTSLGVVKLLLLQYLPYQWVLRLKKIL